LDERRAIIDWLASISGNRLKVITGSLRTEADSTRLRAPPAIIDEDKRQAVSTHSGRDRFVETPSEQQESRLLQGDCPGLDPAIFF